jgi:DNA primase
MIPDETVERVRAAADAVGIIGEFVPLKRSGASWRGPCPFHQGKNANFSVTPATGTYHCFVCHESGDVFTFVRKRLGLDWPAAVKFIGEKVGIEVIDAPRRAQAPDPNAPNHEALTAAGEWFQRQLLDEAIGREARAYCTQRGLDESAWERFGLGFAPRDAQALRRHLHALGIDDARQLEAGLLVLREGETEPRVRFRGRVMFPIADELGRAVGFGGRAMGDEPPKYLNSPESPVFQKRRTLYGLHTAKQAMRRAGRAIVVEGYLDVIRLALAGIEEVVAPLGTALTEEQAQLLLRYAGEIYLLYDSDEAGQKATFRSGLELLRQKGSVRVVSLPEGEDPDSFVRTHGAQAMEGQIAQAIDLFDRQVQMVERRGMFADITLRRRALDRLLPTIRAAADSLTRDLYLTRLSGATGLDKATLGSEADALAEAERRRAQPLRRAGEAPPPFDGPPPEAPDGAAEDGVPLPPPPGEQRQPWKGRGKWKQGPEWKTSAIPPRAGQNEPIERALVRAMVFDRGVAERVAERHAPDSFRDARYRELFDLLLSAPLDDDLERIAERCSPPALATLRELTNESPLEAELADITLYLRKLAVRSLDERLEEVMTRLALAESREEKDVLLREKLELTLERNQILPVRSPRTKPKG